MEIISTCAARDPLSLNCLATGRLKHARLHSYHRIHLKTLESGRARWIYRRCCTKVATSHFLKYRSPICSAAARVDSHQTEKISKTVSIPLEGFKFANERAVLMYNNGKMELAYEISSYEDDLRSKEGVSDQSLDQETSSNKLSGLKQWWRSIHDVYHDDIAIWGVGSSPIFTVYEGNGGQIKKVTIDENEIQRRQGVEPLLTGSANDETRARAEKKIMLARAIAKDIETGRAIPRKDSTIFTVVKPICKDANVKAHQQVFNRINHLLYAAAPAVKTLFLISMPIYGIFVIWSALLLRKKTDVDNIQEETSETRLEKMRKLKARINSIDGNKEINQVPLASSEFMKRILEVREMARQVRSGEASEKEIKDSHTVIEYDLEDQAPIQTSIIKTSNDLNELEMEIKVDHANLLQENNLATSENGNFSEEKTNFTARESKNMKNDAPVGFATSLPTLESAVANIQSLPLMRRKPRIITSLEEAKAIIDGKKSRFSADFIGRTQYQVADASMIPSTSYSTLPTTRLKNSQGSFKSSKSDSSKQTLSKENQLRDGGFVSQKGHENLENRLSRHDELAENSGSSKQTHSTDSQLTDGDCGSHRGHENLENERSRDDPVGKTLPSHTEEWNSLHERLPDDWKKMNKIPTSTFSNTKQAGNEDIAKVGSTDLNIHSVNDSIIYSSVQSSGRVLKSSNHENILVKNQTLSENAKDTVGSGQPLREEAFPNTKRWNKELQKKYELERDPRMKELIKEIGSELPTWVTEEEIEQARRMATEIMEGNEDQVQKRYEDVRKKIENERNIFGLEAVLEKYREYQPKPEDELWWLDLRHVLCLMVVSSKQDGGFYGLDMEVDLEGEPNQRVKHVIAFEDRKDAINFCRLLEHKSDSEIQHVDIYPFSPKQLYKMAKEEGFSVTLLRTGQIKVTVDSSLGDVEEQILGIGKSVYWEREERKKTIDIDSILHQRFGL